MSQSNLGSLDMNLLLTLEVLLRVRNVSHAAQELGISQSALSTRLARLRDLLADKLFVPSTSGRGIAPTPRAESLEKPLSEVIALVQAIVAPPGDFEPSTSERTFVIGLHRNPAAMLAPDLIPRMLALAPHVRIGFVWPTIASAVEQLEAGSMDLVLGSDLPLHGDLIARTLLEEPLQTAQRAGHPRGLDALDLDGFCRFPHVIVSETDVTFNDHIDRQLAALGRSRRVVASLKSFAVVPALVERSDILCTLPSSFLARYGETLDRFAPPLPFGSFRLSAYWHPRQQDDAGHAWLRRIVYDVVGRADHDHIAQS